MKNLINQVINLVKNFFGHWNSPAKGNYISSKELVSYSVGGMGVQFVAAAANQITLSSACLLLGSVYGIKPSAFATILLVNTLFTIAIQPLKSWLIDNTNTKQGKMRPYILWLSVPSAILAIAFAYLPYQTLTPNQLTILVCVLFCLMNFVFQFYLAMYLQLPQLMTPNTEERATVYSFSSIVYSLAPTITGALFPALANLFAKGLFDVNFYRTLFPICAVVGVVVSLLAYFGTRERIVVPKTYEAKVGFVEGMKMIGKYRYFWIINLAIVFIFARAAVTGVATWMYTYMLQNNMVYAVLTLLMGTASLVGMILGPILSKKFGKKMTTIISDLVFAGASLVMVFFNNSVPVMFICLYLTFWGAAVQMITLPSMNGDALDFLQLKTGERLEGFTGNFVILTSLIAIGTNYIIPMINEHFGLIDNYDVLYDASVRSPMFATLAALSVAGAIIHALIYIPWDLTEEKHAQIIEALKERAREENEKAGFKDASILFSGEDLEAAAIHEEIAVSAEENVAEEVNLENNETKEVVEETTTQEDK